MPTPTPLTREQIESLLVGPNGLGGRCGRLCALFRLYDPESEGFAVGLIPSLSGPIAAALWDLGSSPVDPTVIVDSDLTDLESSDHARFLDVAHLRLLEACLDNADEFTQQQGMDKDEWNQRIESLRQRIKDKQAELDQRYSLNLSDLSTGVMDLGFLDPPRRTEFD